MQDTHRFNLFDMGEIAVLGLMVLAFALGCLFGLHITKDLVERDQRDMD